MFGSIMQGLLTRNRKMNPTGNNAMFLKGFPFGGQAQAPKPMAMPQTPNYQAQAEQAGALGNSTPFMYKRPSFAMPTNNISNNWRLGN